MAEGDDDKRNSPYTEALLQRLPEPGRELEASMKEVSGHVMKDTNAWQRPWFNTCLTKEVLLVRLLTMTPGK